jgi:hypothetical protein
MLPPDLVSEFLNQNYEFSKSKMMGISDLVQMIPKYHLKNLSENLFEFIIEDGNEILKYHNLGRMIFHLKNLERLSTYVGVEKLILGALIISPEKTLEILSIDSDMTEISKSIKKVIQSTK